MTTLVTDHGFGSDDWSGDFTALADLADRPDANALDIPSDTKPEDLPRDFIGLSIIRVDFPSSADGRGFTLARRLRQSGYTGRLRARGHVLADQYAMARRVGFDEVEISAELAARQPEDQWIFRANWQQHDYQSRLRA